MSGCDASDLERLDVALLALRRLVDAPGPSLSHGEDRIEVSTMLVVDAITRSSAQQGTVGEVAETLQVAHSTASRLVDRAARAGMLVRTRADEDARRTRLVLTDAGRALQREAVGFRTQRLAEIVTDWPAADVAALAALLHRFATDAIRPQTPRPPARGGTP